MFTVAGVTSPDSRFITAVNYGSDTADVWTFLINTATAATTYTLTYEGWEYSYYNDAHVTAAALGAAILEDMGLNATEINTLATVTFDTATLTFTRRRKGVSAVLSVDDTTAALVTITHGTTGSSAGNCYIGRLSRVLEHGLTINAESFKVEELNTTTLVVGVFDWTVTYASGTASSLSFKCNGLQYSFNLVHNVDTATTVNAAVTAINARMPAYTVLASNSSSKLRLTLEVKGMTLDDLSVSDGTVAAVHTTLDSITSLNASDHTRGGQHMLLIPVRENDTQAYYEPRKVFRAWYPSPGTWVTVNVVSCTSRSKVFYNVSTGNFTSTAGANCAFLPGFTFGQVSGNIAQLMKI